MTLTRDLGSVVFFRPHFRQVPPCCAVSDMQNKKGENLTKRLSNAERFHCTAPSANMDQYPALMDFLPKEYKYHICSYKAVNAGTDHTDFEATLRMSLKSKEEIVVWLKSMPVTWRVDHTRPRKGSKIIFKTEYRCQHNTKPRATTPKNGRASKNTDCPAKLKVALARTEVSCGRQSRSTDPHIPDYPTLVHIVNVHNHNIHGTDAVRHRDVGSKAVEQLTKLFEAGHSPSSALDVLKYDLQAQLGNDYVSASADRSICPELQFCYRLYQKILRKEYGSAEGKGMLEALERQVAAVEELEADETLEAVRVSAQEWDSMSQEFAAMVQSSEGFQVAGSAFVKAFNRLKGNPSMMMSAMHMFGCYGASSLASKRARALRRAANRAGPSVAIQPTSVARQKVKLVGRRRLAAGRPKKKCSNNGPTTATQKSGTHSSSQAVEVCRSNPK